VEFKLYQVYKCAKISGHTGEQEINFYCKKGKFPKAVKVEGKR
jgi:hypothetical protein